MSDPERWFTAPDAPEGMRELLLEARNTVPSVAEKAALGAKIGAYGSGLWLSPLVKALAIGAVVVGGGALLHQINTPRTSTGPVPVIEEASEVASNQDVSVEALPKAQLPVPEAVEEAAPEVTEADPPSKVASNPIKPSEAHLLSRARASLATDPARSLALLAQHERLYPRGALAEEREVLEVRALQKTGRDQAAAQEAAEFRKQHPDSIHHLPEVK